MDYGNLAYKDEYYVPKEKNKPQKNNAPSKKKKSQNKIVYIKYIFAIIVMAISAGFMITTFVTVNETRAEVKGLEDKLASEEAITSQKAFDLEHSMDLATIEEKATSELGMKRPEKYQTIYVNVDRDDVTDVTASEIEKGGDRFLEGIKNIVGNIVEFFSIQ